MDLMAWLYWFEFALSDADADSRDQDDVSPPSATLKAEPAAPSTSGATASKPKPCCVCKDEKARRDDCMLFSKSADPTSDCKPIIDQYKTCMAGFGFQI
ncbi:cytochrome C oxidase copper chaperone-domain-containing protein [Xylaria sp. CBS 124048]|nr:cytochrome C oxidase copper chaperone-domain-containing protein [Xylaria sp. CBS 124048]